MVRRSVNTRRTFNPEENAREIALTYLVGVRDLFEASKFDRISEGPGQAKYEDAGETTIEHFSNFNTDRRRHSNTFVVEGAVDKLTEQMADRIRFYSRSVGYNTS